VGLFEGKKIGRAKNLEKLTKEITAQEKIVANLKSLISERSNEVITFNEQLKESAIRQTQQDINIFTNAVFALQNKIENIQQAQETNNRRSAESQEQLEENFSAIETTRFELGKLNSELEEINNKMTSAAQDYSSAEQDYTEVNALYNENNLLLARQQSKVTALQQELDFKTAQLTELNTQIQNSNQQLTESSVNISETSHLLDHLEISLAAMLKNKDE
jgi:chromosome segregation protein